MVFNMKNTKKIYKQLSLTVFLLLTMTGFSSAVYAVSDQSNTAQIQSSANKKLSYQRSFKAHKVPELELVDMQGNQVILASLINAERPVLLNFIFTTCPSFCPILSATFGQVQHKFDLDNPNKIVLKEGKVPTQYGVELRVSSIDYKNIIPYFENNNKDIVIRIEDKTLVIRNKTEQYVTIDAISIYYNENVLTRSGENFLNHDELAPNTIGRYNLNQFDLNKLDNNYYRVTSDSARKTNVDFGFAVKYRKTGSNKPKSLFKINFS